MSDHDKHYDPMGLDRRALLLSATAMAALLPLGASVAQAVQPLEAGGEGSMRLRNVKTSRHRTAYIEAGPVDGPLMIFVHGHPELGILWRAQIEHFAAAGWRCVAPDMRGYGGSSMPARTEAYTMREIVKDMTELHDSLGGAPAVWVGHDFGGPVVWQLAATEGRRCRAVTNINLPYFPAGFGLVSVTPFVDRRIYPADRYPFGQWDYMQFYTEDAAAAARDFRADVPATLAAIYGKGSAAAVGKPAFTATVREKAGWFGPTHRAPKAPRDPAVLSEATFSALVESFEKNGFSGPNNWYRNEAANRAYAQEAPNGGRLALPVLYLHARYDVVVDTVNSRLADPMRAACADLTEATFDAGHWLPQERPSEVNAAIEQWLVAKRLS